MRRVVVYPRKVTPGPLHVGVCGLALLGAAAVACAGKVGCEIFTNEADFLAAVAGLGLTLAEVEDFEPPVSNLGPLDFAAIADPLTGGVPNVDPANGLGFPWGLGGTLLFLQSNIVQENGNSVVPGSGLAAIGPGFLDPKAMDPDSVEVGANVFAESTDLVFLSGSELKAVGFRLRGAFPDVAVVAVFEPVDGVLVAQQALPITPEQAAFVGVVCLDGFTVIGRVNVGGPGGELVDDVEMWQMPVGACCVGFDSCTELTQTDCNNQKGSYQGDGTVCPDACDPCGGPNAGDCCVGHGTPGCNDAACCATVCAFDSFCCGVDAGFWEEPRCVDLAIDLCGGLCAGVPCPWDCGDGDGTVGIVDFLALLGQWGAAGGSCDFNGSGVGIVEFLELLGNWGDCP